MQEINKEVGQRIRTVREQQKLSREKLAERADISTQFLADIEGGKKGMTITTLKKLCLALGISADFLVFGNSTEKMLTLPNQQTEEVAFPSLTADARLAALPPEQRKKLNCIMQLLLEMLQS